MRAVGACLLGVSLVVTACPPAAAADERPRSPYEVELGLDLGLSLGSLVVLGLPHLLDDQLAPPWCGLDCDPDSVNRLDRTVIGNHSHTARLISDVGVYTAWALPLALGAVDVLASDPDDGWSGYGTDVLVMFETLAVTSGANVLLKFAFRRPRPYVYDDVHFSDDYRLADDASLGFPSGHTATAFAMATAYSYTFTLRHPDSPWRYPVWIGTYAVAGLTGVMRTQAGKHFWTDVLAGAGLGIGLGLLIPWLHLREEPDGDHGSGTDAGPGPEVVIGPMALPNGAGAFLTIR